MTATPPAGEPVHRSGYTLTLLRKGADGRWRLARDANLLTNQVKARRVEGIWWLRSAQIKFRRLQATQAVNTTKIGTHTSRNQFHP